MGASLVYLTEPITEIEQEEGANNYLKFVTASMQGWRLNMEDSHLADVNFMESDKKSLFGVFDGHGGREVAVYCKKHYGTMLADQKKLIEIESVQEWLRQSFLQVDEEIKKPDGQNEIAQYRKDLPPKKSPLLQILSGKKKAQQNEEQSNEDLMLDSIGCTANVVYIDYEQKMIYVANAGDSRCTMGKGGKTVEMSIDHKPDNQVEQERITKAGSTITDGRVDGNLNLSRSLGDLKHKQRDIDPKDQAITANPDIFQFQLTDDIDFIIMGCDGIWEKRSNDQMIEYIYDKLNQYKEKGEEIDLKKIVSDLLLDTIAEDVKGANGVGCDNMTCILIYFDNKTQKS